MIEYLEHKPIQTAELENKAEIKQHNPTPEEIENTFKMYKTAFGLTEEELVQKRIIDAGCGENALFIRYAVEHGAQNTTGVDIHFTETALTDEKLKNHLLEVSIENLPLKDVDLIVSYASVATNPDIALPQALHSMVVSLKPGGEIRIYPVGQSETLEGVKEHRKMLEGILKTLDSDINFTSRTIEKDIITPDGKTWSKDVLIIHKNELQNP